MTGPLDAPGLSAPRDRSARSRKRLIAAAVPVGLVAIAAAWLLVIAPERHADGAGPLSATGGGVRIGMSAQAVAGDRVTFGIELCLAQGSEPAIIDSVGPTTALGSGVTYLGSRLWTIDLVHSHPADDATIGVVRDFPPPTVPATEMVDAIGAPVRAGCQVDARTEVDQLLVGFGTDGTASGGWHGVDVGYRTGWRHRVVSIDDDLFLCLMSDPDCDGRLIE